MKHFLLKVGEVIAAILFISFALIGPGGVLAFGEAPFGIGPITKHGEYCTDTHLMAHYLIQYNASPTAANLSLVRSSIKTAYKKAPNQEVKSDISNYVYAIAGGSNQAIASASNSINEWIKSSCTISYSLPYTLNGWWGGFMGQRF